MNCHTSPQTTLINQNGSIALVGHPNVGKSVIFQYLTGQRVVIANYPGTTVEIARGSAQDFPNTDFIDTPGVITFPSHSDDEEVTARVLLEEPLKAVLHVGDAKNLRRTLLLTVQIIEMGIPMVLALNMKDEADSHGIITDYKLLGDLLGIPVVPTTAVRGNGLRELRNNLLGPSLSNLKIQYPENIENAISKCAALITDTTLSPRALALLWLSQDPAAQTWISDHYSTDTLNQLNLIRQTVYSTSPSPVLEIIQNVRADIVEQITARSMQAAGNKTGNIRQKLGRLSTHPVWGAGILAIVLLALYWFVGIFGAGTLVGLLEENLFGEIINPWVIQTTTQFVPGGFWADLLVGEYGLWTMGMTYALALILPIVSTFFLAFGMLEDSGYLPRLAALSNQLFQKLGLNGKAVLPMVLGLGCVTMATLTTRVLESKRERFLVTLLLALAIPCSAQLGVVMGMLAAISLSATAIWAGVVGGVLLIVGWLAAKLTPGERTELLIEIPPLRWPVFSNVLLKTLARLEWYLKEVIPLFLLGTAVMFILDKIGLLPWLNQAMQPMVVNWLGLPAEASGAFLMGFMRRDFGATGLFIMEAQGLLTAPQVVVAMVAITLFIPCVASVFMIARERGKWTAAGMVILIFPLAFIIAGLLSKLLLLSGWGL
ncbi:MAG TPA: ferrous iron transport protein B [Chloroflexi bacterium]|nr:ferrous iron transport protein B [Chloroflexota bacterium]